MLCEWTKCVEKEIKETTQFNEIHFKNLKFFNKFKFTYNTRDLLCISFVWIWYIVVGGDEAWFNGTSSFYYDEKGCEIFFISFKWVVICITYISSNYCLLSSVAILRKFEFYINLKVVWTSTISTLGHINETNKLQVFFLSHGNKRIQFHSGCAISCGKVWHPLL